MRSRNCFVWSTNPITKCNEWAIWNTFDDKSACMWYGGLLWWLWAEYSVIMFPFSHGAPERALVTVPLVTCTHLESLIYTLAMIMLVRSNQFNYIQILFIKWIYTEYCVRMYKWVILTESERLCPGLISPQYQKRKINYMYFKEI